MTALSLKSPNITSSSGVPDLSLQPQIVPIFHRVHLAAWKQDFQSNTKAAAPIITRV